MASEICVFAENYNGNLEAVVAELVSAANLIKETTGEKISALLVAKDCEKIVEEVKDLGVDEVYVVKTDIDCAFKDDAVSLVIIVYAHLYVLLFPLQQHQLILQLVML